MYTGAESAFRHGDFQRSFEQAQRGLGRWSAGDWSWRFRLLSIEDLIYLGRPRKAHELLDHAGEPSTPDLRARWMMDRARLMLGSDPTKSRELLLAALKIAPAGDPTLLCMIRLRLGEATPNFDAAESIYREALAGAQRQHDDYLIAWSQMGLGFNRARAARFDEALGFLNEALRLARGYGAQSLISGTLGNLGWCYLRLGSVDQAMASYSEAERISAATGLREYQFRWLTSIGNIYMERGQLDDAARAQQRALDLARKAENDTWIAIVLNNEAELAIKRKDYSAARVFNDQALEIKRRQRNKWSLAYSEWNAANIEAHAGRYKDAEAAYCKVIADAPEAHAPDVEWAAYGGLADLYQTTHRPQLAEVEYRHAIDAIDREWHNLGSSDFKTTFLSPSYLIGFFQDYAAFQIGRGERDRALAVVESARARVLSEKLEQANALPADLQIAKLIAAARTSHTVLLSYWVAPQGSSVWVIGPTGLTYKPLAPGDQIKSLVASYMKSITDDGDPLADAAASTALYKAVLEPVQKLIPAGWSVIVVPDGPLHQLAFDALVVPEPKPHYWIEDASIAVAPSLRVLEAAPGAPARTPKLLLIGDPVLRGQEFPPLVHVKEEIKAVEDHFPNRTIVTGADAVPGVYTRQAVADATDLYFATHAVPNVESPLNSAIILSHQGESYKLYARDVARVPVNAEVVTLSACTSAGAAAYSGEGLMGFAWAFLEAGAGNVVASLWDESDSVSAEFMGSLYTGLAAGQNPAAALRAAKLELLRSKSNHRLPFYWATMQVYTRRMPQAAQPPEHLMSEARRHR